MSFRCFTLSAYNYNNTIVYFVFLVRSQLYMDYQNHEMVGLLSCQCYLETFLSQVPYEHYHPEAYPESAGHSQGP